MSDNDDENEAIGVPTAEANVPKIPLKFVNKPFPVRLKIILVKCHPCFLSVISQSTLYGIFLSSSADTIATASSSAA